MNVKPADQNTSSNEFLPILYWLLGSIWAPITLPWIIYQMLGTLHQKYKRTNLNSKVVLITGASTGLGEALAHAFYDAGCRVILAARRKDELERVKKDLLESHKTVPTHVPIILPLDLADLPSLSKSIETVLGICSHIDILVNNGGITSRGDVLSTDLNVYERLMLVNYFGQVSLTKAVLPSMILRKSGHIVLISSVQGLIGIPFRSAYAASKHAVQAFFDCLRAEVAEHNIEVTVVSPGYIKTDLSLNALTASGAKYGQMDDTTANGYSPDYVADQIVRSVVEKRNELIIAQPTARIAIYLRRLLPSAYFWIMNRRAKKGKENM